MNTDTSDTTEYLKQLVRHAEYATLGTKVMLALLIVVLCVAVGSVVYFNTRPEPAPKQNPLDWYDVDASRRQGDLQKALKQAHELLTKNPRDFDGLYQKGEILLMLNDREGALKSFQEASDIFPIYKYKSAVDALKKS